MEATLKLSAHVYKQLTEAVSVLCDCRNRPMLCSASQVGRQMAGDVHVFHGRQEEKDISASRCSNASSRLFDVLIL